MKFSEHLSSHLTPEWRKQYIQYDLLKDLLYSIKERLPIEPALRSRSLVKEEEIFFSLCKEELEKINLFFAQKFAEAQTRNRDLQHELAELKQTPSVSDDRTVFKKLKVAFNRNLNEAQSKPVTSLRSMKLAFSEFYLSLILLQNYQQLNATGFKKILKKHDKVLETLDGLEWRKTNVEAASFFLNKEINQLIGETENIVTQELEAGNRTAAMKRLRVPPLSEKQSAWTTFKLGLFLGSFSFLALVILLTILFKPPAFEPRWIAVRLFRGFAILFANVFLVGINMYGWQSSGVNHVLIFEIDPRNHLTYQALMEISAMWSVIWAVCVLGYLYDDLLHVPDLTWPLVLMFLGLSWLFNPFKCGYRSARRWFLKRVLICFTAPFHFVTFPDFWLGDQMNSLVTLFMDMEYFACFYIAEVDWARGLQPKLLENVTATTTEFGVHADTGVDRCSTNVYGIRPLIAILPACIRFLQCLRRYRDTHAKFPHLVNAGKYASTFFVILFGTLTAWHRNLYNYVSYEESPFFYGWIIACVVSTSYTYVWDVKMDWGFFDQKQGDNPLLREELVYSHKWYYYFAIIQDLILRFGWTLNVTLGDSWLVNTEILICVTAALECFRRFVWNFFRLENEHVNNVGQFRAVRDISLRPINKGDLDEIIRLMDDDNGIKHRGMPSHSAKARKRKAKEKQRRLRSKAIVATPQSNQQATSAHILGFAHHTVTAASNLEFRKLIRGIKRGGSLKDTASLARRHDAAVDPAVASRDDDSNVLFSSTPEKSSGQVTDKDHSG